MGAGGRGGANDFGAGGGASLLPLLSSPSSDMSEYAGLFAGGFSCEASGEPGPGLLTSPPRRFTSSNWGCATEGLECATDGLLTVTNEGSDTFDLAISPAGS